MIDLVQVQQFIDAYSALAGRCEIVGLLDHSDCCIEVRYDGRLFVAFLTFNNMGQVLTMQGTPWGVVNRRSARVA